jgi:ferritin
MSKLEQRIQNELSSHQIKFELQKAVPIENYPWQTSRSKSAPKCDIYLNDFDLYIEVKGFMTYQAVSKLSYLSRQGFKYYIFQGTEPEWNPSIESNFSFDKNSDILKGSRQVEANIKHQINELVNLKTDLSFLENISQVTLKRLKDYMTIKINEYKTWSGEWY